jgi:hypothetical protein
MKKVYTLIIIILNSQLQYGQELLINPSFENYTSLYSKLGKEFCANGWLIPNLGSVDYYSEKYPGKNRSIPHNQDGYHPAYDGIAYIGLVLFDWSGEMEYITGSLKEPFKKDSIYQMSFNIRYAGDSVWIYSKLIELLFTQEIKFLEWNTNYRYLFKNDKQPQASVKVDIERAYITREWIRCTAEYKAQGGEKYVTFGLFYQGDKFIELCNEYVKKYNDFEKQKKFINTHEVYPIFTNHNFNPTLRNKFRVYAYYFIDNVSVKPMKKEGKDNTLSLR